MYYTGETILNNHVFSLPPPVEEDCYDYFGDYESNHRYCDGE